MLDFGPKRFEKDSRIIMARSESDLLSVRRPFNGVHGALLPYRPYSENDREEIMEYARMRIEKREAIGFKPFTLARHPLSAPPALTRMYNTICDMYASCTGRKISGIIRINSLSPNKPHNDANISLTYTFSGLGTLGVNEQGEEYHAPLDHVFVFDRHISHMAGQYSSPEQPKITIVI
jgi:hypothetical protein